MSVTLSRLLRLSIGSPEIGSLNLNALYIVLKTIIEELNLGDILVDYEENDLSTLLRKVFGKQDFYEEDSIDDLKRKLQESYDSEYDAKKWSKHDCVDLAKKLDLLQEELDQMLKNLSNFHTEVNEMVEKARLEEIERKRRREITPEECITAIDEMGEAITRALIMLKKQQQVVNELLNEGKITEMCHNVVDGEMEKRDKVIKPQIKNIASAVKNLQQLIKDVLYPEASGITDCLSCGRVAHLPNYPVIDSSKEEKGEPIKLPALEKTFMGGKSKRDERNERRHPLYFTKLRLEQLKKKDPKILSKIELKIGEEGYNIEGILDSNTMEKKEDISLPFCSKETATSGFLPLSYMPDPRRRRTLSHK